MIFIVIAPSFGGDAQAYEIVAQNIFVNGCVSFSNPEIGECRPHWGGNHLPGYPLFIALSWFITDKAAIAPLIFQAIIASSLIAYLTWNTINMYGPLYGKIVALVISLSPITIAWPRMELTETLSISLSIWVLAALVRSINDKKIHWFEIGIVCAVGILLRYDFILLFVPIIFIAFKIDFPMRSLRACILIVLLASIPATAWWARSINAGLSDFPPFGLTSTGEEAPQGVLDWMGTWVNNQYQLPKSVWPLVTGNYFDIDPPSKNIRDETTGKLVDKLTQLPEGSTVPLELDKDFAELAKIWKKDHLLQNWVGLPIQRAFNMWLNPFPSIGWPGEVGPKAREEIQSAMQARDTSELLNLVTEYSGPALMKIVTFSWRVMILTILGGIILFINSRKIRFPLLLSASIIFAFVRTIFFAETILVETRYLVPAMVWLEFSLIITILNITVKNRN